MDKKLIVRFLKEKKKGCYSLLVRQYVDLIMSMSVVMALEIIRDDLQAESGEKIHLNYFSFAKAFARFKKKNSITDNATFRFKDAHELGNTQPRPGKFKLG